MYNYKEAREPCTRTCEIPGCGKAGEHKAPRERREDTDYAWFCLDHVREYNKAWNYFEDMDQQEIEAFMKDAITGHRPTWHMGANPTARQQKLEDEIRRFMGGETRSVQEDFFAPPITSKQRRALKVLGLTHPAERTVIKAEYKKLVKRYHPDVNGGNKEAEETFKKVTQAYSELMQTYGEQE